MGNERQMMKEDPCMMTKDFDGFLNRHNIIKNVTMKINRMNMNYYRLIQKWNQRVYEFVANKSIFVEDIIDVDENEIVDMLNYVEIKIMGIWKDLKKKMDDENENLFFALYCVLLKCWMLDGDVFVSLLRKFKIYDISKKDLFESEVLVIKNVNNIYCFIDLTRVVN